MDSLVVQKCATDFAEVHCVREMATFKPQNILSLQKFLIQNKLPLSIKGSGFSHGGHTLVNNGVQLDLQCLNRIQYDSRNRSVSVEAGCIWYDVIQVLHPFGRTVAEMQSYYNFSVGGSISVNCHGRGLEFGSISDTIISLVVMTSSGEILNCSHVENYDLFKAVIGGYGLIGIILEANLLTVPNDNIELEVQTFKITDNLLSPSIGSAMNVSKEPRTVFFNANIYPEDMNSITTYSWKKTNRPITHNENDVCPKMHLIYPGQMLVQQLVKRTSFMKKIRSFFEPSLREEMSRGEVFQRSYIIGEDANKLNVLTKALSTTILQEYFVPVQKIDKFNQYLMNVLSQVNAINVSYRYVRKITHSMLNYAPEDAIAIVLYINVWKTEHELNELKKWTSKVLFHVHQLGGTFYLPYLLTYDSAMIYFMYTAGIGPFLDTKRKYDVDWKLRGLFLEHILSIVNHIPPPIVK